MPHGYLTVHDALVIIAGIIPPPDLRMGTRRLLAVAAEEVDHPRYCQGALSLFRILRIDEALIIRWKIKRL